MTNPSASSIRCRLLVLGVLLLNLRVSATTDLGNIWPLGDSITFGYKTSGSYPGGYRDSLYTNLLARGYSFKLVGTTDRNASDRLVKAGQDHHDGHPGFTIADITGPDGKRRKGIYDGAAEWHKQMNPPSVILLLIGINDLNHDCGISTAPDRLNRLITRLFHYYPHARILVSSVLDAEQSNRFRFGATNDLALAVNHYNAAIASMVAKRKAQGQKIFFVDMHAHFTRAELDDGLHPTAAGYVKMGNIWANAIVADTPGAKSRR